MFQPTYMYMCLDYASVVSYLIHWQKEHIPVVRVYNQILPPVSESSHRPLMRNQGS